jgi:ABC-type thiamine transport system ATPase subunit
MLQANAAIHPPLLRPEEMAELLAALVAQEQDVAALVGALAPRNAAAIVEELLRLADGRLAHDAVSHALRWILPELHEQLAGGFRAALA